VFRQSRARAAQAKRESATLICNDESAVKRSPLQNIVKSFTNFVKNSAKRASHTSSDQILTRFRNLSKTLSKTNVRTVSTGSPVQTNEENDLLIKPERNIALSRSDETKAESIYNNVQGHNNDSENKSNRVFEPESIHETQCEQSGSTKNVSGATINMMMQEQSNESRTSAKHNKILSMKEKFIFPTFKGENNDNIEEFIRNFKRAAQLCGWSSSKQAQALPLYLKGIANQWFNSLVNKDTLSLDKLIQKLKEEFSSEGLKWRLRQNLAQRKQKANESLNIYKTDIRSHCKRLDLPKSEWLHHFVKGLTPDIKYYVILQKPRTLEQAENLARLKESVSFTASEAINTKAITDEIIRHVDQKLNLCAQTEARSTSLAEMEDRGIPLQTNANNKCIAKSENIRDIVRQEIKSVSKNSFKRELNVENSMTICDYSGKRGHSSYQCTNF